MILSLLLTTALANASASDDPNRQDSYETMLSCTAFHTIEAIRSESDTAEAQQAVAYDFAKSAVRFAPDGTIETANADLEKLLATFREKLDTGDVREVAEGWTALESACRRLYPVRDELGTDAAAEVEAVR